MSNPIDIKVPDIGDVDEVDVIEVLVAENDTIEEEQSLITLESDKASMEIPAPQAGTVTSITVKVGDKVSEGSVILQLIPAEGAGADDAQETPAEADASAEPAAPAPAAPEAASTAPAAPAAPEPASPSTDRQLASQPRERHSPTAAFGTSDLPISDLPHASPSVRKYARELGVDLTQVKGSGARSRITHKDVQQFVKDALQTGVSQAGAASLGGLELLPWPEVDFEKFGPVETQALSRIKKISGANLHRNWVMIPHVTNNDVADITDLEALRKTLNRENEKTGPRVTILAFIIKAVVAALKKFPEFNASLAGDNLVLKQYYNIGFAADTPNGLVVPVIKDADQKGVLALAEETAELAGLAREGKLSAAQMQGGCFTISSLGGIGGTDFTPIINAPELAILGVSRSTMQPVWDGNEFVPRLMLPLSLSYDHRVIDGAAAARFNAYLSSLLADFRRITL